MTSEPEGRPYSIIDCVTPESVVTASVPHKWIKDNVVWCPANPVKEQEASRKYADPDDSWVTYPCVVRKTFPSYAAARAKLRYADESDGLESTDPETLGKGSRKKFRKKLDFGSPPKKMKKRAELPAPPKLPQIPKKSAALAKTIPSISKPSCSSTKQPVLSTFKVNSSINKPSCSGTEESAFEVKNSINKPGCSATAESAFELRVQTLKPTSSGLFNPRTFKTNVKSGKDIVIASNVKPRTAPAAPQNVEIIGNLNENVGHNPDVVIEYVENDFSDADQSLQNDNPLIETQPIMTNNAKTKSTKSDEDGGTDIDSPDVLRELEKAQARLEALENRKQQSSDVSFEASDQSDNDNYENINDNCSFFGSETEEKDSDTDSHMAVQRELVQRELQEAQTRLEASKKRKSEKKMASFSSDSCLLKEEAVGVVLKSIRVEQEKARRRLENLEAKVDTVLQLLQKADNVQKPQGWPKTFPLKSRDSFFEWEIFLRKSDNFNFAVNHFCAHVGQGSNEKEMATNFCKTLFSPELASTLNWQGSSAKTGIKGLKCGKLIVESCTKKFNGKVGKSTISGAISGWLRSKSKKDGDEDQE